MVEIVQVTENVWAHTAGETVGNVAWVSLGDFLVMVDSGMDPITASEIRNKAEETTGLKFQYLILTHSHSYHVLGNQAFKDCVIVATKETAKQVAKAKERMTPEQITKYMEQRPEFKEKWQGLEVVVPTEIFEKEYTIESDTGKRLLVIETGGHTAGSAFVFVPEDKVVIAGDLMFAQTYPYGGDPTSNIYTWIQAFNLIAEYEPRIIVPGHGPITDLAEVELQKNYFNEIVTFMEKNAPHYSLEELLAREDLPEFPFKIEGEQERIEMRKNSLFARVYEVVKKRLEEES